MPREESLQLIMATGTTYTDSHECLIRLQTLIIDLGTDVLRNIFDQKLPSHSLNTFLANEKTTIKKLKVITKTQYALLYPKTPGKVPTSAEFDITLLVCLLRSVPSLGLNLNYTWNTPPQPTDTSVEADICRLKVSRNEIAHIASTNGFTQALFQTKWADIEQVLVRLNAAVGSPVIDLKQKINHFKNDPIDPQWEQKLQSIKEQWQKMYELEEEISHITTGVQRVLEEGQETNTNVKGLRKEVKKVKEDVAEVKQILYERHRTAERSNQSAEENYRQMKTNLKKELIDFYKNKHSKFHLSPIMDEEEDTPLLEFYVMPDINVITFERAFGGGREERTQIADFRGVFFKDDKPSSEIYLTADAGLGKTSFSKRLTLTWCHAKDLTTELAKDSNLGHAKYLNSEHATGSNSKDSKYLREEEVKTMDEFDFLFLVFLRNSKDDCHIIDMIMNQIVQELELDNFSQKDIQNILYNERCLVILDGLDEWSHPENSCKRTEKAIPHRKAKQCTILTTTRPWKLSDVKASQIDQKLEIAGLSEKSADCLKERIIPHLCAGKEEKKRVDDFNISIKEKKITNLVKIPIMLMYFLCLFCENRELGRSSCMLYSNITDMLFYKTKKQKGVLAPEPAKYIMESTSDIPLCFKENEYCKEFYPLLTALGKLAFHTLLVETKEENTLVFNKSVVRQFLNKECLKFCLKSGILTQSKVRGKLTKQETKVSFAHKTVQEFFAALCSTIDPVSFQEKVLSKCKCVKDILEMSKVLIFVSGFNEELSSLILYKVINIVNNDPVTHEYRSTVHGSAQLKEFQDLCVSCCKEFTSEFQHNLSLQNVFIDKSCQEEQYREILKQLTTRNTQDIRSLFIHMSDMYKTPYNSTQKVIDYFVLRDLVNIEKIHYRGKYSDEDILPLLNSSVKSLSLQCNDSRSHLLFEKVKSLQKLEAINIVGFKMSHRELKQFSDYISHTDCMKEIKLWDLSCTDHEDSCTDHEDSCTDHEEDSCTDHEEDSCTDHEEDSCTDHEENSCTDHEEDSCTDHEEDSCTDHEEDSCTDHEEDSCTDHEENSCTGLCVQLEQHEQLRELTLINLPVTEVVVNMSSLEKCGIASLCNPDLVLKFTNHADCKLEEFYCDNLKSSAAIDTVLDTLPLLHHLRQVELWHINLGRRKLTLSPQVNIERLWLFRVTMEASTLRELVDCVHKLPQPVTVDILGCIIPPVQEFNTVKEEIKTSQRHFRILREDGRRFVFATIKD